MSSPSFYCTPDRDSAVSRQLARRAVASGHVDRDDPPDSARCAPVHARDEAASRGWALQAIVRLHFLLLDDCARLADPATPLEDKFELLRWIYTEPERDAEPFSFAACLRLFGRATYPAMDGLHAREIRAAMRPHVARWLEESFARYPAWVRTLFARDPEGFARRLEKDPQALNKAVYRRRRHGDLFAAEDDFEENDSHEQS